MTQRFFSIMPNIPAAILAFICQPSFYRYSGTLLMLSTARFSSSHIYYFPSAEKFTFTVTPDEQEGQVQWHNSLFTSLRLGHNAKLADVERALKQFEADEECLNAPSHNKLLADAKHGLIEALQRSSAVSWLSRQLTTSKDLSPEINTEPAGEILDKCSVSLRNPKTIGAIGLDPQTRYHFIYLTELDTYRFITNPVQTLFRLDSLG